MDPPFCSVISALFRLISERLVQVPVNGSLPIPAAHDDLVQINIVQKRLQGLTRLSSGPNLQRRTQMDFADLNPALHQTAQPVLRLLEFDRKMAGVIIHPQMLPEPLVAG